MALRPRLATDLRLSRTLTNEASIVSKETIYTIGCVGPKGRKGSRETTGRKQSGQAGKTDVDVRGVSSITSLGRIPYRSNETAELVCLM